jgi:hypothetical protein
LDGIRENPLTGPKLRRPFKSTPYHANMANFGTSIAQATIAELLPPREWSSMTRRSPKVRPRAVNALSSCFAEIAGSEYGTRN